MTVKELREKLEQMPQDAFILLECSNCGYRTDSDEVEHSVYAYPDGTVVLA
jgi:hypothetical protein